MPLRCQGIDAACQVVIGSLADEGDAAGGFAGTAESGSGHGLGEALLLSMSEEISQGPPCSRCNVIVNLPMSCAASP